MDRVEPGGVLPDGALQFAPAAARALRGVLDEAGAATVAVDGLDAAWPPIGQLTRLMPELRERVVDGSQVVWSARLRKTEWELDRMRAAARVLEQAYDQLREVIAPGMTEREIARAFIVAQWQAGAHEVGPLAVVADPSRGLFGAPTDRPWERDELLYVDGAAIVDGYWSDFCRTFAARPVARARIGMVFQRFNLFSNMSVLENVMEGQVSVLGRSKAQARERAGQLLERIGLRDKLAAYPAQLSGGQQQRVAIARALACEPELMLFDEPTSALDPELVDEVLDVTQELAATGMTMIVVTHEIGFAREVANRVAVMDDGRIIETGAARQVLSTPEHARTRASLERVLA